MINWGDFFIMGVFDAKGKKPLALFSNRYYVTSHMSLLLKQTQC
jgi:hypothetical protein